jgi:hypothetical protein
VAVERRFISGAPGIDVVSFAGTITAAALMRPRPPIIEDPDAEVLGCGGGQGRGVQGTLVVVEIAIATTLSIGGGLLLNGFVNDQRQPGFDPRTC